MLEPLLDKKVARRSKVSGVVGVELVVSPVFLLLLAL